MTRRATAEPGTRRVVMTQTRPGSEDGLHVSTYLAGETYEMGPALAESFLGSRSARPAKEQEGKGASGGDTTKKAKGPAENK